MKMCKIPSVAARKMDRFANWYIHKWLGLPRCFSNTGCFRANSIQLPIQSITLGYKQEKSRLILNPRESVNMSFQQRPLEGCILRKLSVGGRLDEQGIAGEECIASRPTVQGHNKGTKKPWSWMRFDTAMLQKPTLVVLAWRRATSSTTPSVLA